MRIDLCLYWSWHCAIKMMSKNIDNGNVRCEEIIVKYSLKTIKHLFGWCTKWDHNSFVCSGERPLVKQKAHTMRDRGVGTLWRSFRQDVRSSRAPAICNRLQYLLEISIKRRSIKTFEISFIN